MTAKANIGLIGTGAWGRHIARNLAGLGALGALDDHDNACAQKYAAEYAVRQLPFSEMLADASIEAIALATPPAHHHPLALDALNAGKHIYVEKPLALTLDEATAIAATAKTAKRQVMVGHLLRYHAGFLAADEAVKAGKIGKLRYIHANRLAPGRVRAVESVLYDLCPHDLAMIYRLVNGAEAQHITCQGISHITTGIDDIITANLQFDEGVEATLHASWMHPIKRHELTLIGSAGALIFDDSQDWHSKLMFFSMPLPQNGHDIAPGDAVPIPLTPSEPLKDEMRAFINMTATNTPPPTDITEALYVQKLLARMQDSIGQPRKLS